MVVPRVGEELAVLLVIRAVKPVRHKEGAVLSLLRRRELRRDIERPHACADPVGSQHEPVVGVKRDAFPARPSVNIGEVKRHLMRMRKRD